MINLHFSTSKFSLESASNNFAPSIAMSDDYNIFMKKLPDGNT